MSDLRRFFEERGWVIDMDDREGQPLDPFPILEAEAARDALTAAVGRIEALRDEALLAVDTLATQHGPTSSLALLWRAKADSYIAVLAALSAEGRPHDGRPRPLALRLFRAARSAGVLLSASEARAIAAALSAEGGRDE